jgi:hypothetical protein
LTAFYRAALRRDRHQRADRIEDINAGLSGGRDATRFLTTLRNSHDTQTHR